MALSSSMSPLPNSELRDMLAHVLSFLPERGDDYWSAKDIPMISKSPESIKELEKEALSLNLFLESFQKGVRRRILAIHRRRNQLVPIHGLPVEILANIFLEVQATAQGEDHIYEAIKPLAGVSSYWYHTILSTPKLWVFLDGSRHPTFVKSIIKNSKTLPLHVWIPPDRSEGHRERNRTFLNTVIPYISRWKTFRSLSIDTSRTLFQYPASDRAARLEFFEASTTYSVSDGLTPELPDWVLHSAPRLHTLTISLFSFPLGAHILGNLQSISFSPIIGDTPFTSDQWQAFLSASANLEFIEIHEFKWHEPISLLPVHLPRLRSLKLERVLTTTIGALLSSIIPSPDIYPVITIEMPSEDPVVNTFEAMFAGTPITGSLLDLNRRIRWMSLDCIRGYTSFSNPEIRAGAKAQEHLLAIRPSATHMSRPSVMRTISRCFSSQVESLKIAMTAIQETREVVEVLTSFQNLQDLTIISHRGVGRTSCFTNWRINDDSEPILFNCRNNLLGIMRVLSSPKEGDPNGAWPCPNLRYLSVEGTDCIELMTLFIQTRYGPHFTSPDKQLVPLEILRLANVEYWAGVPTDHQSINRLELEVNRQGGILEMVSPTNPRAVY